MSKAPPRQTTGDCTVEILDRAERPDLVALLSSQPAQVLMSGKVDLVQLVRVKSYWGKARLRHGSTHKRSIRLNVRPNPSRAELILLLCHEVAHHGADLIEHHSQKWRKGYARLVEQAGQLGLLSEEQVREGLDVALNGHVNAAFGWREQQRERVKLREGRAARAKATMLKRGVQVGSIIAFRYKGDNYLGEVVRINRKTISVDTLGNTNHLFRLPFPRVQTVIVRDPSRLGGV